ncbi:MAG: hypothetical protein AAGF11_06450 [Myxococcota bacterium]
MSPAPSVIIALAALVSAPATPSTSPSFSPGFSPGIGYTVSLRQRQADDVTTPTTAEPTAKARSLPPILPPPPPSDLARVQNSPRAQGILAAAAIAAQVAMLVAGVASVRQQNAEIRRQRRGRPPPYRPYR